DDVQPDKARHLRRNGGGVAHRDPVKERVSRSNTQVEHMSVVGVPGQLVSADFRQILQVQSGGIDAAFELHSQVMVAAVLGEEHDDIGIGIGGVPRVAADRKLDQVGETIAIGINQSLGRVVKVDAVIRATDDHDEAVGGAQRGGAIGIDHSGADYS